MLNRLVIQNYALIDNLEISFSDQLNILTGETGAGKSIILGALSLILGQRAESKYFFNQQKKCVIEGHFHIPNFHLKGFFTDNDLDYGEETVLRREITPEGKSRAFVNDTPVNLTILKELGEHLIDIHSQHATLEINDAAFQLLIIDTLAENQNTLSEYAQLFLQYRKLEKEIQMLIAQNEQSKSDLSYYQFQFDELEKAQLRANEQEHLENELNQLTHAEEIKRNLASATYLLAHNDQSILNQLKEAAIQLQLAEKFSAEVVPLAERLKSSLIEIKDIAAEVEGIEQNTHLNEARASEVNERLSIIYYLQKKHRVNSTAELLEIQHTLSEKLSSILNGDDDIQNLQRKAEQLKDRLLTLADHLHHKRVAAIPAAEDFIKQRLAEVGMPHAVLRIENAALGDQDLTETGRTEIRFLFTANKGHSPAPMNKVASGGELSRLMLSIKSLIARHTALPTIVFDEIDTGISGEIASKVGSVMEKLSENMQVIAITHLPQIASKGKAHYRVYKDELHGRTLTNIQRLTDQERIIEVAKMLSGENPGDSALNNAKELLTMT